MTTKIPSASRNAAVQAVTDLLDAGDDVGFIEIRTGAQPSDPNAGATGTLLATLPLSDPAFAAPVAGVATADVTPEPQDSSADVTGTAGWYRAFDSYGTAVLDGSVTETDDGGDMQLNTLLLVEGVAVKVTSWTLTMPSGA